MSSLVKSIKGSYVFEYHADGPENPPVMIDFTPPFRRISMIKGLEEALSVTFPTDLNTPEARQFLDDLVRILCFVSCVCVCVCVRACVLICFCAACCVQRRL